MEFYEMTASALSRLMQAGEASSSEVVKNYLDRIGRVDPQIRAFITVSAESALEEAREVDRRRAAREELHPLAGVPVALKDNICTEGLRTTCASKMMVDFIPPYQATVAANLRRAGLPVLGKTNLDEFACGSSTESSAFYPTCNPWDPERVPGGSSGGSAAAVAAGMAPLALGSDSGGSVRLPAAFCGLTGLRPTYGRVSRYGLVPLASSMDQIGPMALDAADCALLLGLIAGTDPLDSTTLPGKVPDYNSNLEGPLEGLRIGVIIEHRGEGFDPAVTAAVDRAAQIFAREGAGVDEVSLPHQKYALPVYRLLSSAESSSNLARYDGVRFGFSREEENINLMFGRTRGEGFGPEVKGRILLGTYLLGAGQYDKYYLPAGKARTLISRDFWKAFEKFDLLLGAVTPTPAFRLGERKGDPDRMAGADFCLVGSALAGLPSISVPFGQAGDLPLGVQLTAPALGEALLLRAARFLEERREPGPNRPRLPLAEKGGK